MCPHTYAYFYNKLLLEVSDVTKYTFAFSELITSLSKVESV